MTREEEIKARLDNGDYMDPGKFLDQAPDDIRYLLSRNEELQRRVEKMERVCKEVWDKSSGDTNKKMIVRGSAMIKMFDLLDAKEQDDD